MFLVYGAMFAHWFNVKIIKCTIYILKAHSKNDQVNFEIYDITTWLTTNCNIYIAQYLKK